MVTGPGVIEAVGVMVAGRGMLWASRSLPHGRGMTTWSSLAGSGAIVISALDSTKVDLLSLVAAYSASQDH